MLTVLIAESSEIETIEMIDPKTGCCWEGDFIFNAISCNDYRDLTEDELEIHGDVDVVMTRENFDWWSNQCSEYQRADILLNEIRELERQNNEYGECGDLDESFHHYINGYDFESQPAAIVSFCNNWNSNR